MARIELPTCRNVDPSVGDVPIFANGDRALTREAICYGLERCFEFGMFEYVFRREAIRMWGSPDDQPNSNAAWDWLDDNVNHILKLLRDDPIGVFSKRIGGDPTNWRNLAAFANFYWWVSPEGKEKLDQDIANGNGAWANFVIDWARPRAPAEVMTDPAYGSRQSLLASTWPTGGGSTGKGFGDTGGGAAGLWPIELPTGNSVAIPGLPPVCSPFPNCVLSAVPMALQAVWNLADTFLSATPGVVQVRDQSGLLYRPGARPDVATDADLEEVADMKEVEQPTETGPNLGLWLLGGMAVVTAGLFVMSLGEARRTR